jgi:hypothetical protein
MEPENQVDAGSETSGETAVDTTAIAETAATDTSATASVDAGGASSETTVKAGDTCTCPDGRTGTVHSYDEGLICIPNADQG